MRKLNGLVLNEWLKLTKKRSFFIPYAILISMILSLVYFMSTFAPAEFSSGEQFVITSLSSNALGQLSAILSVICCAGMISSEFQQGTIKFLLIRARSRSMILASKTLVMLFYAFTMCLTAGVSVIAASNIWFGGVFSDSGSLTRIALALLASYAYVLVYVLLTLMISVLTQSTGATIGGVLLIIIFDKLMIYKELYKYFLFPNLDLSVYLNGAPPLPGMTLGFSLAVLGVYAALFLLVGFTVFKRKDVA